MQTIKLTHKKLTAQVRAIYCGKLFLGTVVCVAHNNYVIGRGPDPIGMALTSNYSYVNAKSAAKVLYAWHVIISAGNAQANCYALAVRVLGPIGILQQVLQCVQANAQFGKTRGATNAYKRSVQNYSNAAQLLAQAIQQLQQR